MVVAALCIPCMTAAASAGPAAPLVLGAATLGYFSFNKNKTMKKIKTKVRQKSKNAKKTKQKGGTQRRKKFSKTTNNIYSKCRTKCPELTIPFNKLNELSFKEKQKWNTLRVKRNKCWNNCDKAQKLNSKLNKKKNPKELKKKCCRCHYIKSKKSLRRVKGNWGHCSYDLTNCCKDKKTIINS